MLKPTGTKKILYVSHSDPRPNRTVRDGSNKIYGTEVFPINTEYSVIILALWSKNCIFSEYSPIAEPKQLPMLLKVRWQRISSSLERTVISISDTSADEKYILIKTFLINLYTLYKQAHENNNDAISVFYYSIC